MKYFTKKELSCKCCGVNKCTDDFMIHLNYLRYCLDAPMFVNCAYRCPKHNKEVGGGKKSYHKKGMAIDVRIPNVAYKNKLIKLAYSLGWTIGIYGTFLHLDRRKSQIIFSGS